MEDPTTRRSARILFDAVRKNNIKIVEELIKHGTNIDGLDYDGNSPVHYTVLHSKIDMLELLLNHGAKVDLINKSGLRPYNIAMELRDFKAIKILLKHKARINIDDLGCPLQEFPKEVVDLFYELIDVHDIGFSGYSALHHIVRCNDLGGIIKLLSKGADVNLPTVYEGYVPLHLATSSESVKILLKCGAKSNIKDKYECTPLYLAAIQKKGGIGDKRMRTEQGQIIEMLLEKGADGVDIIYTGQIAFDYGKDWESMEGFKDVLRHMAMIEHEKQYMNQSDLRLNDSTNEISNFYRKCLEEVARLKKEIVVDNITFYDFARKNVKELSRYVRNKKVVEIFKRKQLQYEVKYPIFCEIMQRHSDGAFERYTLWEEASISLSMAVQFIDSQHIVTQQILRLLKKEDMRNLVEACTSIILKK